MQNIGAYGVEIKSVFEQLEAIEIDTLASKTFNNEACQFGYRYSIFKGELKGKYIITQVYFKLQKKHSFNTSYGAIEEELKNMGATTLSLKTGVKPLSTLEKVNYPTHKRLGIAALSLKTLSLSLNSLRNYKKNFQT